MLERANDKLLLMMHESIDDYVSARGIDNIKGCVAKDVYNDYLEQHYKYTGYINFRKYIMEKYNLDCVQVRVPGTSDRTYIFI